MPDIESNCGARNYERFIIGLDVASRTAYLKTAFSDFDGRPNAAAIIILANMVVEVRLLAGI